jgi:uroporphyrinogen-III synthase
MRLLLTRPEPDAAELRSELEALGHQVLTEPLLRIELLPVPARGIEGAQALVVTSRNGVRALAGGEALPSALSAHGLPLYCVGEETAALARASGFSNVVTGAGKAQDLVPLITRELTPASGPIIHVAGEQLAFDLAGALSAQGFGVRTVTAYRAVAAGRLSGETAGAIAGGRVDGVVLMSPRTAATFAGLVAAAGLADEAAKLNYICISDAVAQGLGTLAPDRRVIAKSPNRAGIIAAAGRVATRPTDV